MQSVFFKLNNIQTNVLTWGEPFNSDDSDVIICITGNPGIPHFYEEFATELNKRTGLPVCVIGQAGHVEVPDERSNVLEGQEHLFDLEGQVRHKLDLIEGKIDKHRQIHLVGHSIGAWLILAAIDRREDLMDRVRSVDLLFPTIQKMAESPNGRFLNAVVRRLHYAVMLLVAIIHMLPDGVKRALVRGYLKWNGLPAHYDERILKCGRPLVLEKVLHMAYDEMDRVRALAAVAPALARVAPRCRVLAGARDGWAPAADTRALRPGVRVQEVDVAHGFVLGASLTVAALVADFIKPNIKSCQSL